MDIRLLRSGILLALWTACFPANPQTAPSPALTLQQVIETARAKNPTLLAASRHVDATKAAEITAGLRLNPTFTLSGSDTSLPADNPSSPYTYVGNISRTFERGEKRRWRLDIASATTAVTRSQYEDQERQTMLQVKNAFTNMLAAKAGLQIAKENLDSYSRTLQLSKARLDAGDISKTDFERIDLQFAQFESDFSQAKLQLEQASDSLQLLMGAGRPNSGFDIAGSLQPPQALRTLPEIEQDALRARPDLVAAIRSVDVANAQVRLADANAKVDPTVGGEYERVGVYNSAGFQISIPLRIFDRNQGERERTRYEAQSAQLAETAARNQVLNDVAQAWTAYQAALQLAERYNGHYLAESEQVRDNLEFSYRHGNATLLDYLDALRDYRQIQIDALNANQQVWLSIHQLSFAAATEIVR